MAKKRDALGNRQRPNEISRRSFLGRAAVLGTSAAAGTLYPADAGAQTLRRGGYLKAGMQGGESTNVLDPALNLSQVPF
jgi:peptide/nickel transport system substrate-binding protein